LPFIPLDWRASSPYLRELRQANDPRRWQGLSMYAALRFAVITKFVRSLCSMNDVCNWNGRIFSDVPTKVLLAAKLHFTFRTNDNSFHPIFV
jgi:hypothetical protein